MLRTADADQPTPTSLGDEWNWSWIAHPPGSAGDSVAAGSPPPSATWDHDAMAAYLANNEHRALVLANRGPIRFDADGALAAGMLDAYWSTPSTCSRM